jgi:hypothetical protein
MHWFDILERDREGRLAFFPFGRRGYVISSAARARWIRIGYHAYFLVYIVILTYLFSDERPVAALASVAGAVALFGLGAWLATRRLQRTTSRLSYRERMRQQALLRPVWTSWLFVCFGLLTVSAGLILLMRPWPRWILGALGVLFGAYIVVLMVWMISVRTFASNRAGDSEHQVGV